MVCVDNDRDDYSDRTLEERKQEEPALKAAAEHQHWLQYVFAEVGVLEQWLNLLTHVLDADLNFGSSG